jgi:hypothetical protein
MMREKRSTAPAECRWVADRRALAAERPPSASQARGAAPSTDMADHSSHTVERTEFFR